MVLMPLAPLRLGLACALILAVAGGCTAARPGGGRVLADRLDEFLPHGDRDHFVFRSDKFLNERSLESNLVVEHISALASAGEFEVAESIDGLRSGDSRWLSDARGIALLSEDLQGLGVRLEYDPPLLIYPRPLVEGEHVATAAGLATSLADGAPVGMFRATLRLESRRTRSDHPLAAGSEALALRVTRSLHGPGGALVLDVETVNAAGIGEVQSVARLEGVDFVIRRTLVCGFIQGRAVGRCDP